MPPKFLIYFKYTRTEIIYAHSSIIKFIKLNKILNLSLNLSSKFQLQKYLSLNATIILLKDTLLQAISCERVIKK